MNEVTRNTITSLAKAAAYRGDRIEGWETWQQAVQSSGVAITDALGLLRREYLHWFASYAFKHSFNDEGIEAYERLLDANLAVQKDPPTLPAWSLREDIEYSFDRRGMPAWIYSNEAMAYLTAVGASRGIDAQLVAYDRFRQLDPKGYPEVQLLIADVEAKAGRTDEALSRLRKLVERFHMGAEYHEALARHAMNAGVNDEARYRFIAAAKRGLLPTVKLKSDVKTSLEELESIQRNYATPEYEDLLDAFVRSPGHTLLPASTPSSAPVHVYGSGNFEVPNCVLCDAPLLLLATIDAQDAAKHEPSLLPLSKTMAKLPLVHCDNCQLMFFLHDYQLTEDGSRIEFFGPPPSKVGNSVFNNARVLTAQKAELVAARLDYEGDNADVAGKIDEERFRGPQIGGCPRPINEPRRRFCPKCDDEQIFFAAFCESSAFDTPIAVNPDGYMYYYACPRCRIISSHLDNT